MAEPPVVFIDGDGGDTLSNTATRLLEQIAGLPEGEGRGSPLELSVVLTDDATIGPLNAQWRGVDRATDVLSFAMEEGRVLGDVVISLETAQRRVDGDRWSLDDELTFLLIHGLLHLLGHDHEEEAERARMESAEQALWTGLGRVGTLR